MTTKYESSDGVIFDSEVEAKKHQAVINKETSEFNAQRRKDNEGLYESYNYVIDNFNEGNWDNVVNTGEALLDDNYTGQWFRRYLDTEEKRKVKSLVDIAKSKGGKKSETKEKYFTDEEKEYYLKKIKTIKTGSGSFGKLQTLNLQRKALEELRDGKFNPEEYEEYYSKGELLIFFV